MYSDNFPCYTCQCTPDFNGTDVINNPNCQLANCDIQDSIGRFIDGCIPIYYGKHVCCPINWKCRKFLNYLK